MTPTPDRETDQGTFRCVVRDNLTEPLTRRRFLGVGAGAAVGGALLSACGGGDDTPVERAAEKWFADQTIVADGSPQRTVWSLRDDEGNLADLAPDTIEYLVLDPEGAEIASGIANRHADGLALPYYPIVVPFGVVGPHEFRFTTENHGNHVGFASPGDLATSTLLWPGDPFPSVVTPTVDNPAGVTQMCTRNPNCPFHDISLDAAIGSGEPTILMVSTPAFCSTVTICGPVLELLIDAEAAGSLGANVIHAEVYADPQPDDLGDVAPIVAAAGVIYEPFLFHIDADGRVAQRLDHVWDRAELAAFLDRV